MDGTPQAGWGLRCGERAMNRTRVPISSVDQHHRGRTRCRRSWLDIRQCRRAHLSAAFLTQLRESSLYRSRIVNTWGFDMDDVKAVIEQATNAAIGTLPEAAAKVLMPEMGTPPEAPIPEIATPPEAPVEAPKPEMKKVRRAA